MDDAKSIMKRMRRDPEAIERYRDALLSAGVIPDDLTDEQIIERTARLMVAVIEFGRKMRPFMLEVGAAITRVAVVIREAETSSPGSAALMAVERHRMANHGPR